MFRNLPCERIQVDEIWSFVHCKQKNVNDAKAALEQAGDIWTWTAIEADTRLIPSFYVGRRDAAAAFEFIGDLAMRLADRVQLTSDGHKPYLEAVEQSFGADIDYAMLVKIYGDAPGEGRYSPGVCTGAKMKRVEGRPDLVSYQHKLRRAAEPIHADGHASVHTTDERLQQEGRKPCPCHGNLLHALQFRSPSSDATLFPSDGGRSDNHTLGTCRYGEGARRVGSADRFQRK